MGWVAANRRVELSPQETDTAGLPWGRKSGRLFAIAARMN